jgi:hypothetical protein
MKTKPEEIAELIRRQPRLTSERFWQQLEKARALSPSVESLTTTSQEPATFSQKIPPVD